MQKHVERPLLFEGRKAHIKFYLLLMSDTVVNEQADAKVAATAAEPEKSGLPNLLKDDRSVPNSGTSTCTKRSTKWRLWTRKDGYLSIAPTAWSPTDLSSDTQVTIIRHQRIS